MRKIYLVRHGEPEFENGKRICLGRIDLPLSRLGRMQAVLCGEYFADKDVKVFSSSMRRAYETARAVCAEPATLDGLEELDLGEWDGKTFEEIKEQYPELYRLRGEDPEKNVPPGGETFAECSARAEKALIRALETTDGDIAIFGHAGVNRILIAGIRGDDAAEVLRMKQPYGCVCVLYEKACTEHVRNAAGEAELFYRLNTDGEIIVPRPELDARVCELLLAAADTPEHVRRHCRKVAEMAMRLANIAEEKGYTVDRSTLFAASSIHDIARGEENHAAKGAELIAALGYEKAADMIALHHDLPDEEAERVSEAALLFLADKLTYEDTYVTIDERFDRSIARCADATAREALERRRAQALRIAARLSVCVVNGDGSR